MKQFLFIFLFIATLGIVKGQNIDKQYIDGVIVNLDKLQQKDVRTQLNELGNDLQSLPKEEAVAWFDYMLEVVESPFAKMVLYSKYSAFLVSRDDLERANALSSMGLELSQSLNLAEDQIWFRIKLANSLIFQNKPDEALHHLNIAEPLAEKLDVQDAIISISYSKAIFYESIEKIDEASRWYLIAWGGIDAVSDHPERGFYLYVLVDFFERTGNLSEQIKFKQLLDQHYHKKQPDTPSAHIPMYDLLDTTLTAENIQRHKDVIRTCDSLGVINSLLYSTFSLSDIYLKLYNYQDAIEVLIPLRQSLDTTNRDQQKMVLYGKLSALYEGIQDYKNALLYKNLEAELRDTLVSEKTNKNIAELEVKYDLQTKERQLEQEAASKKLLYWILGSAFMVLLILSFFFLKNRNKNRKLARQKKTLEETVNEKNFLLKETHHRVKNSFQIVSSLLYLQSEHMNNSQAQQSIKEAQNRVQSMVLIHQKLYSKDQLTGIDTKEYFNDLTREIFGSHQMKDQKIEYSMDVESIVLDIESITPIGLILNELITNVLKHAFDPDETDKALNIEFHKPDDHLVLKVTDNGKGMPQELQESSFGLKLMKALAKKIKAKLTFEDAPDRGTVATLKVSRYQIV